MKKFPKKLYVSRVNEGESEEFMVVLDDPIDVDLSEHSTRKVGFYELKSVITVTKEIKVLE